MRVLIKLAILGLAAFGAQRLYKELRPRVDELRGRTGSDLRDVVGTVKSAAENVRQDVTIAAMQVRDDVAGTAEDLKDTAQDLKGATHEVV